MSSLTLKQAMTILETAFAHARAKNYKKLGVVVLDASGNLKAAAVEDGASMFRIDIAKGKAWGAVAMECSSRALAKRAEGNPNFPREGGRYWDRCIYRPTEACAMRALLQPFCPVCRQR